MPMHLRLRVWNVPVPVSGAPVRRRDETEVAVLPLARDGFPIAYRQASITTNLQEEALMGDFDVEVLTIAGIDLAEMDCPSP